MSQGGTIAAMIRPLQRPVPLRQSVYDALIDLIVGGELPPGQHMVETDLARQLGVSRQPIREALHRMEAEGWVDLRPSQSSGAAVTATPGSFGTWLNGEIPVTHPDSRRTCPNRAITTTAPSTDQAPATQARGASPNSATAAPATVSDAGSWTRAAPSSRATSGPADPVRSP